MIVETTKEAEGAFDFFVEVYGPKYPKVAKCLTKDREELLIFYDFPAEYWVRIRTTNPIESTFATVKLRTKKTRKCLSRKMGLSMVFKLMQSAEKRWRKLNGQNRTAEIIPGVSFKDAISVNDKKERIAA